MTSFLHERRNDAQCQLDRKKKKNEGEKQREGKIGGAI